MSGEISWLVIAIELWPYCVMGAMEEVYGPHFWDWYVYWLIWGSPPLVLICAVAALFWHFRSGRPRHWSHRFGLAISMAQCVPSGLLMIGWFGR